MVIMIKEVLVSSGLILFLINLILGILVLVKEKISKKFKIVLGIVLIVQCLLGFFLILIGMV